MKNVRILHFGWALLLVALVFGVSFHPSVRPALASNNVVRHAAAQKDASATTSIAATIYVTSGTIQPMFQSAINQDVPQAFNSAIANMLGKLPAQDRGWASQMATTIIQPSASLLSLVTQKNGLATSIRVSLYPGDPQPTTSNMLISFSVLDSRTIQVSGSSLDGSPALASGPLQTISMPLGVLNAVGTTPNCGDSALSFNLQIPVALSGQSAAASTLTQQPLASAEGHQNPMTITHRADASSDTSTFIEIPASSITSLNQTFSSFQFDSSTVAKNIRLSVQGNAIHVLSDIYWNGWNVGSADTTLVPTASGGNLEMSVTNTSFSLFGIFPFQYNTYNQMVQQMINNKLSTALAGQFTVNQAQIGPTSQLPCARSDSLVLVGTSNIG
jgi:hypothetical protein